MGGWDDIFFSSPFWWTCSLIALRSYRDKMSKEFTLFMSLVKKERGEKEITHHCVEQEKWNDTHFFSIYPANSTLAHVHFFSSTLVETITRRKEKYCWAQS